MAKRKKSLTHTFHYDPRNIKRCITLPVSPGKVKANAILKDAHILESQRGTTIGCTISNCLIETGPSLLGHPVYFADVSKTSIYCVDKLDRKGQPKHAVWYKHNGGLIVDLNDHIVERKKLLAMIDEDRSILLQPPVLRHGQPTKLGKHPAAPLGDETPRRRKPCPIGAERRAKEAGFVLPQNP